MKIQSDEGDNIFSQILREVSEINPKNNYTNTENGWK